MKSWQHSNQDIGKMILVVSVINIHDMYINDWMSSTTIKHTLSLDVIWPYLEFGFGNADTSVCFRNTRIGIDSVIFKENFLS